MHFPLNFLLIVAAGVHRIFPVTGRVRLTAVNNSPYAAQLYAKIRNEGTNRIFLYNITFFILVFSEYCIFIDIPAERDEATSAAQIRRQICDDLICNRFFYRSDWELSYAEDMR